MFALLLSFPLLCLQAGGPELPESLLLEPAVTEAWAVVQDTSQESARRVAATELVLTHVKTLPAGEQLPFLLQADGAALLNVDLATIYRPLDKEWELLETRLIESLLQPLPANHDLVLGAIRCAGSLMTSDARLVEGVAAFLDRPNFANAARKSLANLTGRQFASAAEFQLWWPAAKGLGRESWLETAISHRLGKEVDAWRLWLGANPSVPIILDGLKHDLPAVRALAFSALKLIDFHAVDAATQANLSAALRDALLFETVLEQRIALLELVPRFLSGADAVNPLLRALEFGQPSEQQPAARLLKQIQPREVAWTGVLRGFSGVYPDAAVGPSGSEKVRIALWASLRFLSLDSAAPDPKELRLRLEQALAVENKEDVRQQIYNAIGAAAGEPFLPVLHDIVANLEASAADREDALIAMTAIAQRIQTFGSLPDLLPQLLADQEAAIRRQAIESADQLKVPGVVLLLAMRLPLESETVLQQRILAALATEPNPDVLEALLAFKPSSASRDAYASALIAQIANDFATFHRVLEHFQANFDYDSAFRVVRNFKPLELTAEQTAELNRTYAVAVSQYLLVAGPDNGNSGYAVDAAIRLRELMAAEPTVSKWPEYLAELQLDRGEVTEGLAVMMTLVTMDDVALSRKWQLGLYALRNAAALELTAEGRALFAQLDALGEIPKEWHFHAAQVREHFPEPDPGPLEEAPMTPEEIVVDQAGEPADGAGGADGADGTGGAGGGESVQESAQMAIAPSLP